LLDIVVSRDTLSDSVAEQIKKLIAKKSLKVGDELPSQRKLADQLHVGRPSIREALKKLQAMGIVRIQQGRKTLVQSTDVPTLISNMSHVLELTDTDIVYLIETKELIETRCAKLAAQFITQPEKEEISTYLEQMQKNLYDDPVYAEYDYLFHQKIVEAARNPILIVIFRILGNLIKKALEKTAEQHSWRQKASILHRKYFNSLCSGDGEAAAAILARLEAETIRRTARPSAKTAKRA
jgi:GntR family transcriptional repressor for pyruvate dehydrogenase complex